MICWGQLYYHGEEVVLESRSRRYKWWGKMDQGNTPRLFQMDRGRWDFQVCCCSSIQAEMLLLLLQWRPPKWQKHSTQSHGLPFSVSRSLLQYLCSRMAQIKDKHLYIWRWRLGKPCHLVCVYICVFEMDGGCIELTSSVTCKTKVAAQVTPYQVKSTDTIPITESNHHTTSSLSFAFIDGGIQSPSS